MSLVVLTGGWRPDWVRRSKCYMIIEPYIWGAI